MTSIPIEQARFTPQNGPNAGEEIEVQFNPVSLQVSISNTLESKDENDDKKQYVTKTSAKLTLDLIFDTTKDGSDVRIKSGQVARFMQPDAESDNVPIVVMFEWGLFAFQGLVESYKETLDFFAATGVPLRAAINLTLASQEKIFEEQPASADNDANQAPDPVAVPSSSNTVTDVANQAGNPNAARAIAAANGQESLRFINGPLVVSGEVNLRSPAAFATGGIGIGASLSAGLDVGIGASAGIGGSVSVGGGIGASVGLSASAGINARAGTRGSASAGVTASAGAFSGLRRRGRSPSLTPKLKPERLLPKNPAVSLATDQGAEFQLGGKASRSASTSLSANVGTSAGIGRIQFE